MNTETLIIVFIVVEAVQMFGILWNTRRTNQLVQGLMEDPAIGGAVLSEGIHGFILALQADPKKQEAFFGLMSTVGAAAVAGIRGSTEAKPVRLKGYAKIFEPVVNNPNFQAMIAEKIGGMIKATGDAGAEKVAGKVADAWGL